MATGKINTVFQSTLKEQGHYLWLSREDKALVVVFCNVYMNENKENDYTDLKTSVYKLCHRV